MEGKVFGVNCKGAGTYGTNFFFLNPTYSFNAEPDDPEERDIIPRFACMPVEGL